MLAMLQNNSSAMMIRPDAMRFTMQFCLIDGKTMMASDSNVESPRRRLAMTRRWKTRRF
jgi:hypothetical protein